MGRSDEGQPEHTQFSRVKGIRPSWFESNIGDLIHREPN